MRIFLTHDWVGRARLLCPWTFQNIGSGLTASLQGIFRSLPGSNPGLPNCMQIFYCLSYQALEIEITGRLVSLGEPRSTPVEGRAGRISEIEGQQDACHPLWELLRWDKTFKALSSLLRKDQQWGPGLTWLSYDLGWGSFFHGNNRQYTKEEGCGAAFPELKGIWCHVSVHHYLLCRSSLAGGNSLIGLWMKSELTGSVSKGTDGLYCSGH